MRPNAKAMIRKVLEGQDPRELLVSQQPSQLTEWDQAIETAFKDLLGSYYSLESAITKFKRAGAGGYQGQIFRSLVEDANMVNEGKLRKLKAGIDLLLVVLSKI